MPERTFLRYQLQNSTRQISPSSKLFEGALQISEDCVAAHLDALAQLRRKNAVQLQETSSAEIAKLNGKRVLFLGDSLTADELGYRALVCEAANLAGRNGAISGGTSSSLLHLFLRKLTSQTSPTPEIVSIMLGTNDCVSVEREELHQVSPEEYLRNMRAILTWAKKTGARVLLFAVPPILEARFNAHAIANGKLNSNRSVIQYNALLAALANELSLSLIPHDHCMQKEDFFEEDGLHWNASAQLCFAEKWLRAAAEITK